MSEFWDEFVMEENTSAKPEFDELNPFDPFQSGPGKPGLRTGYLQSQRDQIVCLIEPHWYELEWNLRRVKTPDQVYVAFHIDAFKMNPGPLSPLLRPNAESATLKELEATRKERADAAELALSVWNRCQEQRRAQEEIRRVASQFSPEFEQQLQRDLERRTANLPRLAKELEELKEEIRERDLEHKTRIKPTIEQSRELNKLRKRRDELVALLADEKKASPNVKSRLQAITPLARKLATEEELKQKSRLDALEADWKEADAEHREIDELFARQEAFVFRKQVLRFISAKEYTLIPLHLANAIAGLPYITARRSAQRCAAIPCQIVKSQTYELFEFVTGVWKRYRERDSRKPLLNAFESAIRALPKFEIEHHHKRTNWFRAYLGENW